MAEDGLNDFVGLINVMFGDKGVVTSLGRGVGNLGVSAVKGSAKLTSRLAKLISCLFHKITERDYQKTGGKIKNKVLQVKYQDLMYDSIKISNIEVVKEQALKMGADPKSLAKLNEKELLKEFDKFAKKVGLPYSKIPNFVKDSTTGKVEYRIAFSKQHQEAYKEAVAQFNSMISNYLHKKAGIKDKEVCNEMADSIMKEGTSKPLTEAIGEIGLMEVDDKRFEIEMKETFPDYDPKEFAPVEPSAEKKTDCSVLIEENEYHKEKERGNVKKIVVNKEKLKSRDLSEKSIKVQMEQYPNVTVKIKKDDVLRSSIGPEVLDGHGKTLRQDVILDVKKSSTYEFEVYFVDPNTKKVDMANPKRYTMTFDEFEAMMAKTKEKNMKKAEKIGLPDKSKQNDVTKKAGRGLKK